MDDDYFGAGQRTMTHEMGHCLGLWHTHHGVYEVTACSPCWERADGVAGDTTGDFSNQTPPTPRNFTCAPPGGIDACSIPPTPWGSTQPENYMSYAPDSCYSLFTAQQAGRMHCWTEARLRSLIRGGPPVERSAFVAPNPYGQLGASVAIDCTVGLAGSPGASCSAGKNCGLAVAYRYNGMTWVQEQVLSASDAGAGDWFGSTVSVSGEIAVVGAPNQACALGSYCGSVYVFRFNGSSWSEEQKLVPQDLAAGDSFGMAITTDGEVVVVGVRSDNCVAIPSDPSCGSAYVFRYDGSHWVQEQKLRASDAVIYDNFGSAVSISSNSILIGAAGDACSIGGMRCGSAYIFAYNGSTWIQGQKLTASNGFQGVTFGESVFLAGNVAVVGAPLSNLSRGSAYVFRFSNGNWVEEQQLTSPSSSPGAFMFGRSVGGSSARIPIGSPFGDCNANLVGNCGLSYVYRNGGFSWILEQELRASDASNQDLFGWSVSIHGDRAMIGANWHDCCALNQDCCNGTLTGGAAYFFDLSRRMGDINGDGDVDLWDFFGFRSCAAGAVPNTSGNESQCQSADLNSDGAINLLDFGAFQAAFPDSP